MSKCLCQGCLEPITDISVPVEWEEVIFTIESEKSEAGFHYETSASVFWSISNPITGINVGREPP